jgi:glycine C-acetyltransferase
VADIFDKCVKFQKQQYIVSHEDRATAEGVLFRVSPLMNAGPWMDVDGRKVLQFSTNDYLGLASHPAPREAAARIVSQYGVSMPMGARPLTGNIDLHLTLQRQVAEFKQTEDALVFVNGAHAMMGTIAALAGPRDLVVLDRFAHASLVYGARMSGAKVKFFLHNDVESLEAILKDVPAKQAKMVVVDGVYSMQGDVAPLPDLCDLCEKYGARIIVDDAHGTGVFGDHGRGLAEVQNVIDRVDLHLGTFSKAVATLGGFAAGDRMVIDYLKFTAPTILFTKAMPACVAAATIEALKLVAVGRDRREALWRNTRLLQEGLRAAGIKVGNTQSPITPIHFDGTDAVHMCKALYEEFGIWVSAVLYPAVPIGTAILRAIPNAAHSEADIQLLIRSLTTLRARTAGASTGRGNARSRRERATAHRTAEG